jgi:hypothetical protein
MAYTAIPDIRLQPDKKILSSDAILLRDNPIAIAAGDAGAPRIVTAAIDDGAVTPEKLQYPWSFRAFTGAVSLAAAVVLDATMNWRDRFITAQGVAAWAATLANAQRFIPGGADDDLIFNSYYYDLEAVAYEQNTGTPLNNKGKGELLSAFMYSKTGGASSANNPRIKMDVKTVGSNADFILWVSSANGSLNLAIAKGGYDFGAYNLIIGFGPDQGAH